MTSVCRSMALPQAGQFQKGCSVSDSLSGVARAEVDVGISKTGEANRMAVQTSLHPISYTTFEGEAAAEH